MEIAGVRASSSVICDLMDVQGAACCMHHWIFWRLAEVTQLEWLG